MSLQQINTSKIARPRQTDIQLVIVEHCDDDVFLLKRELAKNEIPITTYHSTNETSLQHFLENESIDIVLTDHNMPGFSSDRVINQVKQFNSNLPVIIVSGSIGEDLAVESLKSGADDYIMKGSFKRLLSAIHRELKDAVLRADKKTAEEAIEHMAYHDPLTGLDNRVMFEKNCLKLMESAKEQNKEHALLFLDLDQFKIVNDMCGHVAGDELLKQISCCLQSCIRSNDFLARLGGDEFCILLEQCPIKKSKQIADDILQVISHFRFSWQESVYTIGVSIGLVPINQHCESYSQLLSIADTACFSAKDKGRNCIQVYQENDKELNLRIEEMSWLNRIDHALENNLFRLYSQSIYNLSNIKNEQKPPFNLVNNANHYEFLIRMIDKNNKIIPPGAFIPAAERYGRMAEIDRWVIEHAFILVAKCTDKESVFAINISGSSMAEPKLYTFIKDKLKKYNVAPSSICFEVTETAAIANIQNAVSLMNKLRDLGCSFSLDDFGSGLSSFAYLKNLPVDFIKIDGEFVKNIDKDPIDRAIVKSINEVAHTVGLKTIAEYVENEKILVILNRLGIDFAQGFFLDKPEPIE